MEIIRQAKVAGVFYPKQVDELASVIEDFLTYQKLDLKGKIKALIAPHAGYIYSGKVAGAVFKQILGYSFKKIILIGPSHYEYFKGVALTSAKYWQMPFDKVEVFYPEKILKNKNCFLFERAYDREHCLEVEIPFLQKTLKNFKIIPLLYSEIDYNLLAEIVSSVLDEDSLILVSSDLSHYLDYQTAKKVDSLTINKISGLSFSQEIEACGKIGILALLSLAKERRWQVKLIKYMNSGDVLDEKDKVVGYAGFCFFKKNRI